MFIVSFFGIVSAMLYTTFLILQLEPKVLQLNMQMHRIARLIRAIFLLAWASFLLVWASFLLDWASCSSLFREHKQYVCMDFFSSTCLISQLEANE